MNRLRGKVALVTGAGRGIGRAISERFLDEGASVVLVDCDEQALHETCAQLADKGDVLAQVCDVGDATAVRDAVARSGAWKGRLDALVNNAATTKGFGTELERLELGDWERALAVNLTGPMLLSQQALPYLRQAKGAIVNITSTRAQMSEPNTEAYAACKGGLSALTHALAISLGPAVRVNEIAPGWIHTGDEELSHVDHAQHPCGRVGQPADVAALAAYLVSDEAGFVTGQSFTIDGGMTRKMIYAE